MSTYINYSTKDNKGQVKDYIHSACYAALTYYTFSPDIVEILTWQTVQQINYTEEEVIRWIKEINQMGFPCTYEGKEIKSGESYIFKIDLKKYKYKAHMSSALMLIRYLMEDGIREFPRFYFKMRDTYPKVQKFKLMQAAHVLYAYARYANTNHTLRDSMPNTVLTKKEIFKRFTDSKVLCHEDNSLGQYCISNIWKGKDMLEYKRINDNEQILKQFKLIK